MLNEVFMDFLDTFSTYWYSNIKWTASFHIFLIHNSPFTLPLDAMLSTQMINCLNPKIGWMIGGSSPGMGWEFFYTPASTQPPIKWVAGALSLGVRWPGRDADRDSV